MEEKNTNIHPSEIDPVKPDPAVPDPSVKKPDETKINIDSSAPTNPYKSLGDPIKFSSPFSAPEPSKSLDPVFKNPIDSLPKSDPAKNIMSTMNSDSSVNTEKPFETTSQANFDSSVKPIPDQEIKKSNTGLFIIITVILVVAAAAASGFLVYSWQSSQTEPIQKDKALLQSQVGNLKNQIDLLQKDKDLLQAENARMIEEIKKKTAEPAQPVPGAGPVPTAPVEGSQPAATPAPTPIAPPTDMQNMPANPGQ